MRIRLTSADVTWSGRGGCSAGLSGQWSINFVALQKALVLAYPTFAIYIMRERDDAAIYICWLGVGVFSFRQRWHVWSVLIGLSLVSAWVCLTITAGKGVAHTCVVGFLQR